MRFLLIYILGSVGLLAQNFDLAATYNLDFNTDFPSSRETTLLIDSENNIAYYILDYSKNSQLPYVEGSNEIFVGPKNTDDLLIYNKLNDFIISQEATKNESFWVKDKISFDWNITEDTKEEDGYLLHKATINFRGRDYIAWFTYDIPIPMGPYKFYGLPGLIMEIYDTDIIYHWTITQLKENKKKVTDELYPADYEFLSMREFVEKDDEARKEGLGIDPAYIQSRLPKGVVLVSSTHTEGKRTSFEIEFEWEEE